MESQTQRVLLVDDEPALLSAMRRVLTRAQPNAVVVYASDAASAVWQPETTAVRCVVTDLRMNGDPAAGWAVVRAAKAAGVPAAFITGADDAETLDEIAREGIPVVPKGTMTSTTLAALIARAFES